ncbi:MAG: hypothetical protein R3C40_02780 [Parvularculaceae bacterium]
MSDEKDLEATLALCSAAVEEEPENSLAYCYRGFKYYHLDRYAEAEADLARAIDLKSRKQAVLYFMRGMCKQMQRRLREAAADFKTAHDLNPDWAQARRKVEEYQWAYE